MPNLETTGLMGDLPNLHHLQISGDLLERDFFAAVCPFSPSWPLKELDLDCMDPDLCSVTPDLLWDALETGRFGNLRRVRLNQTLRWTRFRDWKQEVKDIDAFLKALAREDGSNATITEADAGVTILSRTSRDAIS